MAPASPTSPRSRAPSPEKSLVRPLHSKGGRNSSRPDHDPAPGWRPQARLPRDRLPSQRQGRRAGQGRAHRVRPEPHRAHRAAALRRRREALHHRAARCSSRATRSRPVRAPTSSRATTCRCATSRSVPSSTRSSCGPVAAPRSPARPVRQRPAGRQGRAVRAAAHAVRRDPQRRRPLPRHHRRGRQRRAVQHQLGQGRPHALEGQAPDRPWCRHEPGRPPARWW